MFRYLIDHPDVLPGKLKEPAFFNNRSFLKAILRYPKYLRNFPKKNSKEASVLNWPILTSKGEIEETVIEKTRGRNQPITGDASATYSTMANPWVIKTLFPKAKIIFLVRNPTDRFISHWRMFQRFNEEGRKGYDVGDLVPFIKNEINAYAGASSPRIIHQGRYIEIIKRWKKCFSEQDFMLVQTHELQNSETALSVTNDITDFLNLPAFDYSAILKEKFNVAPETSVSDEAKKLLDEFYREPNESLKKSLAIDFTGATDY